MGGARIGGRPWGGAGAHEGACRARAPVRHGKDQAAARFASDTRLATGDAALGTYTVCAPRPALAPPNHPRWGRFACLL